MAWHKNTRFCEEVLGSAEAIDAVAFAFAFVVVVVVVVVAFVVAFAFGVKV